MGLTQKLALIGIFLIIAFVMSHKETEAVLRNWRRTREADVYRAIQMLCIGGMIGMLFAIVLPW